MAQSRKSTNYRNGGNNRRNNQDDDAKLKGLKNDLLKYDLLNFKSLEGNVVLEILEKLKGFTKEISPRGKNSDDGLSTHQLRNFYSKVTDLKDGSHIDMLMLLPQLAYLQGRSKGNKKVVAFAQLVEGIIDKSTANDVKNFKDIMEAIVAYHRFHNK